MRASRAGPSLYVGWGGVAFATSVVCSPEEARSSLGEAMAVLGRAMASSAPWRGRLDLTDGLVGFGVLALTRLPEESAFATAADVVRRLDELARPADIGLVWKSSREGIEVDVGVAHGLAGIVLLLAAAHEAGVERARAERLLDGAVAWVLSLPPIGDDRRFAACVGGPPDSATAPPNAWCWGDVGIALAIAAAARVRDRPDWRDAAIQSALEAAARDPVELGVQDACLCHGTAGVAHVLGSLGAVTGDTRLVGAAHSWIDRALAARTPGSGVGGFNTAEHPWRADTDWIPYGGFQLGAAGTALALLSAGGLADTGWDRALLTGRFV